MEEVEPMQRQGIQYLATVLLLGGAALAPQRVEAQCYEVSPKLTDICGQSSESAYISSQVMHLRVVAVPESSGTTHYLLYGYPNSLDVFKLSNPLAPTKVNSSPIRPAWYIDEGNHTDLTDHLKAMVVANGFPYAFAPLYSWGWDWFEVGSSPKFMNSGYHPKGSVKPGYVTAALLVADNTAYLIGQRLENSSADSAVKIYTVSTFTQSKWSAPRAASALTNYAVVEAGRSSDPAPFNTFSLSSTLAYLTWETGGKRFLLIRGGSQAVLVDVTDPVFPRSLRLVASSFNPGDPGASQVIVAPELFTGTWLIDAVRARLIVASTTEPKVSFFDASLPPSAGVPSFTRIGQPLAWLPAKPEKFSPYFAVGGDILYLGWSDDQRYVNLGSNTPQLLPEQEGITTLPRQCAYETLGGEKSADSAVFVRDGVHFIARNLNSSGEVLKISSSCLSTEPRPNLSVSGGSAGATCGGSGVKGFPGDTFTITNESAGEWVDAELYVTYPGTQQRQQLPANWTPTNKTYVWTAPLDGPTGTYKFDVRVFDQSGTWYDSWNAQYNTTQSVTICGDPEAKITYTPTAFLTGTPLSFSAEGSEGHPQNVGGPKFTWLFASPSVSEAPVKTTADSPSFTPTARGTYWAVLIAHYHHAGSDQLGNCGQIDKLDVQSFVNDQANWTTRYDACTAVSFDSQPFSVGAVSVTQNGSSAQPFQVSKPVNLSAPYKLGNGWNATFAWTVKNTSGTVLSPTATPASQAGPADSNVTGSIAASALPAGNYTVELSASARSGS
ncbi:MAG: hypothetical protein HXY19_09465, partial [Thermoanaerobaculaceae bacterium]|nr:hypothetical protein [Thermoanaerobaculaceae bacterium]